MTLKTEISTALCGTLVFGLVVPNIEICLVHHEPLVSIPLAIPNSVRDATYNVVFAALKTVTIRHPLRMFAACGMSELTVAIIIIDVPGLVKPAFLLIIDGRDGSCHDTFR
jgi:hypothetical protein